MPKIDVQPVECHGVSEEEFGRCKEELRVRAAAHSWPGTEQGYEWDQGQLWWVASGLVDEVTLQ